jgi:hypothetical protein
MEKRKNSVFAENRTAVWPSADRLFYRSTSAHYAGIRPWSVFESEQMRLLIIIYVHKLTMMLTQMSYLLSSKFHFLRKLRKMYIERGLRVIREAPGLKLGPETFYSD